MLFEDNSARMGGALTLEDHSIVCTFTKKQTHLNLSIFYCLVQIQLLKGSEMNFIRNYAEMQGGAVSIRAPTVGLDTDIIRLFNTRCFIQYEFSNVSPSLDPAKWEVS